MSFSSSLSLSTSNETLARENLNYFCYIYCVDEQHLGAPDMLAEILKNIPHKPTKTVISSDSYASHGHSFNQLPLPNNPPPFKPLRNYPSPSSSPHSEYGVPLVYSPDYLSGISSNHNPVMVDPKAYDAYHAMKKRKISSQHNSLASSLPGLETLKAPFEIQKSIEYEIKA